MHLLFNRGNERDCPMDQALSDLSAHPGPSIVGTLPHDESGREVVAKYRRVHFLTMEQLSNEGGLQSLMAPFTPLRNTHGL